MKNPKMKKSDFRKYLKMRIAAIALGVFTVLVSSVFVSCDDEGEGSLPQITTGEVTDIKDIEAMVNGSLTSNGGAKILAMGICWTTEDAEPTIEGNFLPVGEFTKDGISQDEWNFSVPFTGLVSKTAYKVRAYAVNEAGVAYGSTVSFTTKAGKTFYKLTPDMIDTYTQEIWEGPKENLVDGDLNTYWHSAWSDDVGAKVMPLPHHIQVTFPTAKAIGGFKFWTRSASARGIDPAKFDLQTSTDGVNYTTVWTSAKFTPLVRPAENLLVLDKNYTSKYFRIRVLETRSPGQTCTTMSELVIFEDGLLSY